MLIHFFDIETFQGLSGRTAYIYEIITDSKYRTIRKRDFFNTTEFTKALIRDMKSTTNPHIYIAHNGGKFDFLKFLRKLPFHKWELDEEKTIFANASLKRLVFSNPKLTFFDSYAVIPMALKKFGKSLKLPISKQDYDASYLNPISITPKEFHRMMEYCQADVEVLKEGFKKFEHLLKNNLGMKKRLWDYVSLPQIAFALLKENTPQFSKKIHTFSQKREMFFGGRCEIYRMEAKNIYYYDANSLYPSAMVFNNYPTGNIVKTKDLSTAGMYKVKILTSPELYIPPIPYRVKRNNITKNYYPNLDENTEVWAGINELKTMERMGYAFDIIEGYTGENEEPVFEYVKKLYEERMKHKGTELYTVLKLILNSTYGKFSQKPDIEKICIDGELKIISERRKMFRNHIIAGLITSNARNFMYRQFLELNPKNIIYTDTDSIITTTPIDSSKIGNGLGKFKLEMKGEYFKAYQPKIYHIETKEGHTYYRAKGFKKTFASVEEFEKSLKKGMLIQHSTTLKTILNKRMNETYWDTRRIKQIRQEYDKRKVLYPDTLPYSTSELQANTFK